MVMRSISKIASLHSLYKGDVVAFEQDLTWKESALFHSLWHARQTELPPPLCLILGGLLYFYSLVYDKVHELIKAL
jgi:hypothetical protein